MARRTRSSSRSRMKAQFFVLSGFVMITMLFVLSQFVQPADVFDTSSVVLIDEPFIFNNIKEKAESVVKVSADCADLSSNLGEYRAFVEDYARQRNINLVFNYVSPGCVDAVRLTNFDVQMVSTRTSISAAFTATA